jgi:Butyrate kinase
MINIPQKDGSQKKISFIKNKPKILFKEATKAISIKFRFSCCFGIHCISCSLSLQERQEYKKIKKDIPPCFLEASIFIRDSFLFFPHSLSALNDDFIKLNEKQNRPLKNAYRSMYQYATEELKLSDSEFKEICKAKIIFPFELSHSVEELKQIKRIPDKSSFHSLLRGEKKIDQESFDIFCRVWNVLRCKNLF